MISGLFGYGGLFATSFGAASLLPLASEPVLVALVINGQHSTVGLWLVATLGNTLGGVLNWWLARYCRRFQDQRWFPVTPLALERGSRWFQRYGVWSLLMAWAPLVGDALTVVAGLCRVRLALFVLLVAIGKGARYGMLIWLTQQAGY